MFKKGEVTVLVSWDVAAFTTCHNKKKKNNVLYYVHKTKLYVFIYKYRVLPKILLYKLYIYVHIIEILVLCIYIQFVYRNKERSYKNIKGKAV